MSATIISFDEARNGLRPEKTPLMEVAEPPDVLRLLLELAADMGLLDQVLRNVEDMEEREQARLSRLVVFQAFSAVAHEMHSAALSCGTPGCFPEASTSK